MERAAPQHGWYERLVQWWWIQLPLRVARLSPKAGDGLSDGLYLTCWTKVGVLSPLVALLVGFAGGVWHPGETYTQSLFVMGMTLGIGLMSAQLGMWTLVGYALGDVLLHDHSTGWPSTLQLTLWVYVPLLLSYILLGMFLMGLPLAGSILRLRIQSSQLHGRLRLLLETAAYVSFVSVLVYIWTQAMPVLIRPVFTWRSDAPPTEAITPLQERYWVLILVAVAVCLTRVVLEGRARRNSRVNKLALVLGLAFPMVASRRRAVAWNRYLVLAFKALGYTFLLAGMISGYLEGLLVSGFIALVLWARERGQRIASPLLQKWVRVPLLLRFSVGLAVSYAVSWMIVSTLWGATNTFRPVLVATCLSIAIIMLSMIPATAAAPVASRREATYGSDV